MTIKKSDNAKIKPCCDYLVALMGFFGVLFIAIGSFLITMVENPGAGQGIVYGIAGGAILVGIYVWIWIFPVCVYCCFQTELGDQRTHEKHEGGLSGSYIKATSQRETSEIDSIQASIKKLSTIFAFTTPILVWNSLCSIVFSLGQV